MYLLEHFGEEAGRPCGNCDNGDSAEERIADQRKSGEPFPVKTRVVHKQWGKGVVVGYEGGGHDKIVVLFDDVGYKRLATELCASQGLLSSAS